MSPTHPTGNKSSNPEPLDVAAHWGALMRCRGPEKWDETSHYISNSALTQGRAPSWERKISENWMTALNSALIEHQWEVDESENPR